MSQWQMSFAEWLRRNPDAEDEPCETCDGSGTEICDECLGSGFVECDNCDGAGCKLCDGGETECEWCKDGITGCGACQATGNRARTIYGEISTREKQLAPLWGVTIL